MKDITITALDVGSSAIRAVVSQIFQEGTEYKLQVLGAAEHPSEGVNRGSITSIDDASASISACIEKAERMSGIPIESALVGISGVHIVSQTCRGIIAVGKINGEISKSDVDRALDSARTIATPPNHEILHVIPRSSIIDGQISTKDPIGMTGSRLEVDALVIQGFAAEIRNFTKCIYRTNLEIEDLVFSILATAEAVLTNKQKELGVVLINIGASTTSLIVYEEGEVLHTAVIPMGSDHITSDIAIGLRISIELAEKIKLEYGDLIVRETPKKGEIHLSEFDAMEQGSVSAKYVHQIIEARVEEIFDKIEHELKKIGRSGILPGGAILTGGGSKLGGIVEIAKKRLKLPVAYAMLKNVVNVIDRVHDQTFVTAMSIAHWGLFMHQQRNRGNRSFISLEHSFDIRSRVKKLFKSLLP
ncbi:cell division protein FtsA [Candidatus Uhrbacteria bacterium]|nr:cell division protein FtsA [Candidatus Uhrbacteria bacterium]